MSADAARRVRAWADAYNHLGGLDRERIHEVWADPEADQPVRLLMSDLEALLDAVEPPRDWVVHDLTRPDHENPAFGPMTEAQKDKMMTFEPYCQNYWPQQINQPTEPGAPT